MGDRHCGQCKYFGAPLPGRKFKKMQMHICESDKSIFVECTATASGCMKFERRDFNDILSDAMADLTKKVTDYCKHDEEATSEFIKKLQEEQFTNLPMGKFKTGCSCCNPEEDSE